MTKTVALADDAYEALDRLKRPGQSFSDVVRELTSKRRPRIRDVIQDRLATDEDERWVEFKKERREARQVNLARVDLEA
ncbi:MAG: hypothetical protein KY455_12125 [Euryarchaeota archaeon]|nr:hypothetical protein [Euryarchaeota archaeon]